MSNTIDALVAAIQQFQPDGEPVSSRADALDVERAWCLRYVIETRLHYSEFALSTSDPTVCTTLGKHYRAGVTRAEAAAAIRELGCQVALCLCSAVGAPDCPKVGCGK